MTSWVSLVVQWQRIHLPIQEIPESGRSLGKGTGNPLQYSCLGKPTDRAAWAGYSPRGRKRVRYDLATKQQQKEMATCVLYTSC